MPEGEEWVLRPIKYGYYSLADVKAGLIDLLDVARANEHLDVIHANEELWKQRNPRND